MPELLPAGEMVSMIHRDLKQSELVEVEPREAVLSDVAYQASHWRVVLHLLNYRQELEKGILVKVRRPVRKVEVFSPDSLSSTEAQLRKHDDHWEILIPELKTYDLVVIDLSDDAGVSSTAGSGTPGRASD
jgi:hypothetical protein